jgi:hypothetical protein
MSIATILPRSRPQGVGAWRVRTDVALLGKRRLPLVSQPRPLAVPGLWRDIHVQFAATRHDWEQAFELVADNYQARGFDQEGFDYRFTSYHALADTVVLVAKEGGKVVATFSFPSGEPHLAGRGRLAPG